MCIISYELSVAYIIAKLSVDSILDNNQKTPIVCSKCHVVHGFTKAIKFIAHIKITL